MMKGNGTDVSERFAGGGLPDGVVTARPRVAVVVSNPIQHFCPFYRALAGTGQIELRVIFLSPRGSVPFFDPQFGRTIQWQPGLLDGFDFRFLADAEPKSKRERAHALRHLAAELQEFQPDIVVSYGLETELARCGFAWTAWHRRKLFYISDSPDRKGRGSLYQRLRRMALPLVFRRVHAFLTVGDSNRDFYRRYGARENAIFRCPLTVDEDRLREASRRRALHRASLCDRYRLEADSFVILFVGKLTLNKRASDLIGALRLLLANGITWVHLVVAGDGPEGPALRKLVSAEIAPYVHFAGFVPVTELPGIMASADILALPSAEDRHPLAISEALYCGLPILASNGVGSVGANDDVQPGVNGFCFEVGDVPAIAKHIRHLALDRALHERFRMASWSISERRGIKTSVEGFLAAVRFVLGRGRERS